MIGCAVGFCVVSFGDVLQILAGVGLAVMYFVLNRRERKV